MKKKCLRVTPEWGVIDLKQSLIFPRVSYSLSLPLSLPRAPTGNIFPSGQKSVEFVNYANGEIDTVEYSQAVKGKMSKILGFVWTSPFEIVFITDCGIELYTVIPEKKTLKNIKVRSFLEFYI